MGELEHRAWAVVGEPLPGPEHERIDQQDELADGLLVRRGAVAAVQIGVIIWM